MAEVNITDLTEGTLTGEGVFDSLMRATKTHLQEEYTKNRLKGPEYSQVYLGSLQAVMQYALQFVMEKQQVDLNAQLLQEQIKTQEAQSRLVEQQILNAVEENKVLIGQKCKLDAEFDVLQEQKLKTVAETALLNQKMATEKAQISGENVSDDSVVGTQRALYQAQTDGYKRDSEQKAAKLLMDTWNVRRTTDEGTVADGTNKLSDLYVGRAVQRLLDGVEA